jgi:hypothetical protein
MKSTGEEVRTLSKTKPLLDVASDLRRLADNLTVVAESLGPAEETVPEPPKKEPVVTIEQIRAVLAEKSQSGKTAAVRELLIRFGAPKLSEIKSERFAELLDAAREL